MSGSPFHVTTGMTYSCVETDKSMGMIYGIWARCFEKAKVVGSKEGKEGQRGDLASKCAYNQRT